MEHIHARKATSRELRRTSRLQEGSSSQTMTCTSYLSFLASSLPDLSPPRSNLKKQSGRLHISRGLWSADINTPQGREKMCQGLNIWAYLPFHVSPPLTLCHSFLYLECAISLVYNQPTSSWLTRHTTCST